MRVMVFGIPAETAEAGMAPTPEMLESFAAMDKFTEELAEAGVLIAGAGLKPAGESKRILSDGKSYAVTDGPFAEARELVAGFYIWEVKDMDEAVAWALKSPNTGAGVMEIRPFYEAADLGDFISPEELAAPREGERGRLGVA
jgi:hypothetical protein